MRSFREVNRRRVYAAASELRGNDFEIDPTSPTKSKSRVDSKRRIGSVSGTWRSQQAPKFDTDDEKVRVHQLIEHAHRQRRALCTVVFDHFLPFSFIRFGLTVFTYLMLCTDVPRAGLGVKDLSAYGIHEMNHFSLYGPWNYTTHAVTKAASPNKTAPLWSYKFSATSISWRAFATYYNLSEFPDCFYYRSACPQGPNGAFNATISFAMIDAVVEHTKNHRAPANDSSSRPVMPVEVAVRTQTRFYDRFHHYILAPMFVFPVWRTHQAVYFPPGMLFTPATNTTKPGLQMQVHASNVCFHRSGVRPFFCDDIWINYERSCIATDPVCRSVGRIWEHTLKRMLSYQLKYPDKTVDLTLISSHEDVQHNNGGLAYMSRRKVDVATVVRVRDCNKITGECTTVAVDDSRYENAVFATNANEWFSIISTLRTIGQTYFYLRIGLLFGGCYFARAAEEYYADRSFWSKLRAAWHIFIRIPSPSLVYGSPLPVCYAIAHMIDAPLTYEIIAQHFSAPMGQYKFDGPVFFRLAAAQMRNVWCLALGIHFALHMLIVNRNNWTAVKGMIGFPEFSLGFFSGLTMLTQLRMLTFRDSRILSLVPVPKHSIDQYSGYKFVTDQHGGGNMLMEGVVLDLKFFGSLLVIFGLLLVALHYIIKYGLRWLPVRFRPKKLLLTRSPVPYSAGALWPAIALSVSWDDGIFSKKLPAAPSRVRSSVAQSIGLSYPSSLATNMDQEENGRIPHHHAEWPANPRKQHRFLMYQMEHVHLRRSEVDTIATLLNIANMTDPWTYFWLRVIMAQELHYLQHRLTGHVFMLPNAVLRDQHNADLPWDDFVHLASVNSRDLSWNELTHCG